MEKVKVISAAEAAALVKDNDTITTSGFVASALAEELTGALEERFLQTGTPKNLTLIYVLSLTYRSTIPCRSLSTAKTTLSISLKKPLHSWKKSADVLLIMTNSSKSRSRHSVPLLHGTGLPLMPRTNRHH